MKADKNAGKLSKNMDLNSIAKNVGCPLIIILESLIQKIGIQLMTSLSVSQPVPFVRQNFRLVNSLDGPLWLDQLYNVDFLKASLENLELCQKDPENFPLKITTDKKIKGLLVACLNESILGSNPISYNIERTFIRKSHYIPSKLEI